MLTAEYLRSVLHYEPETGVFTWIAPSKGSRKQGARAGYLGPQGYIRVKVAGIKYTAHRLAWLYMTGAWPEQFIDHSDGVRDNNSWQNIRQCGHWGNNVNKSLPRNNTTGYKGVIYNKSTRKFMAMIRCGGRSARYLGQFETAVEAAHAYNRAAVHLHGEFARLNPVGVPYGE